MYCVQYYYILSAVRETKENLVNDLYVANIKVIFVLNIHSDKVFYALYLLKINPFLTHFASSLKFIVKMSVDIKRFLEIGL